MDKLEELRNVIKQWNANRLDLFEISEPNKDLEFTGVMRFYFQDAGQKVATKCIRVSSTASTNDVIETLIEKFRPDIRMLTFAEYALYEIHESGEERKLDSTEKPLVVQLNWNKDDREGRFLLRRMNEKTMLPGFNEGKAVNGKAGDNTFKRKLSKREKKEKKKKEKEGKLKNGEDEKEKLAEKLYNELPETSFTRSISNPEAVMRRRRQQKLEKKLQELVDEGGQEAGGTLRIFGEQLKKEVPYKTLLLSTKENSQFVVKEILEKYGMEKENANDYCLVQLIVPPNLANLDKDPDLKTIQSLSENIQEYILEDDDCPLVIEKQHNKNLGILTFHIRKKPENYAPKRKKSGGYPMDEDESYPFFIEVSSQDGKPIRKHVLTHSLTEVGCSNAPNANVRGKQNALTDRQHLHLVGGNVQPKHCIITFIDGIVTVTPNQDPEAETFVNNLKITDSYILKHGMVVRFGKLHTFNFVDPTFERKKSNQFSPDLLNQMQNSKLNSINNGYLAEQQQQQQQQQHTENEDQLSNYSKASKKSEQQQQVISNILPAVLELWEETEEPFLNSIITNLDVNQVQFKLAPTYTLYLAVRYRSSTHFRPTASLEERAVRLTEFTNKFCQMINYVIHINHSDPSRLAFWLANSSELLHFMKQDQHVRAWTVDGQELLAESVQIAFKKLVTCLEVDLDNSMVNVLSENEQEAATAISKMLTVLNGAMALLRNCRVNAALTIQMFSQIFHYINMHLFNQLVGVSRNENAAININYCTESWGILIKQRLMQIISWAKKQGLELAADCYLNTVFQAATLLQSIKSQGLDNLVQMCKTKFNRLNSLQLRYILQQFERSLASNQQHIPQHLIEQVVEFSQQTTDKLALDYGREIRLAEESDLHLAFLLPEDGYFCDTVRGVPQGLQEFILPMIVHKLCDIDLQPTSAGHWTIFFGNPNFNNTSINSASNNSSNNEQQGKMSSPSKPSVLPGLSSNVYAPDVAGEPTTPTVNNMLSPTNWTPNSPHQPPHFLIPAGPMPTRTMSTNQLPATPVHHPAANFLAQQHQQAIYGAGPMPPQYSSGQQLNMMQPHPAFVQAQQQQQQQAKPEVTMIKLKKGNSGMGLSIVAAKGSTQEPFGIYIKSVVPGGAADMDGRLKAGDQLLKVDGQSLIGITQEMAAELMTKTGTIVTLEVAKQAASYNGLANVMLHSNSPRAPLNKANLMTNRLPAMHSANQLMPKSQTTEHLKQHSASLVNLHPYSTYPYPQQNIQQQQLAMMQLAAIQQQQQQQQILQQPARPSSQMMNMQPPSMTAQQFAAQKRLSTSTMNDDPRNYQPTYQNIILCKQQQQQQQRMNASQNAIYNPAVEQQLIQQQQLVLNRPMSTIMSNRESDQMQQHFLSQTNLSQPNSAIRTQPAHYSSVSQLTTSTTASSMPSWATLPHGYQSQQQQQQQLINQRNNQLAQQQLYMQRVQEEKLKTLKQEQQQQQFAHQPFSSTSRDYPEDELIDEASQTSSSLKKPDSWQDQLIQKTQEEQEERLQKLKLDQLQLNKFQEELQSVNEAEKNLLMIREARKQRREDPLKHYGQQQQQQQSSEDTDTSEEGGNTIQHLKLERILSRGYQGSVSSNGIVTLPPSNSTNDGSTAQRSLSASNVQSIGSIAGQSTDKSQPAPTTIPPIIQSAKSALRSSNKDGEQNGESNGNVKKVSWNEQIVNNVVIHNEEDDDLDEDEDGLVEQGGNSNHGPYDEEDEYQANGGGNAAIMLENGEQQLIGGGDQTGGVKDKIESSFTLQDIDEVLGSPTEADDDFSNNPNQTNNTPNVIGAQEVYRDPRERIKAEKLKQNTQNSTWTSEVPETLSFKEKMKMFATRVE